MLTDLKGYIGMSAGHSTAESGLYVDALPDISLAQIEKMVGEGEDVAVLWDEIENRVLAKFRTLFAQEVNRCHKVNDISKIECLAKSNKTILATALWYLYGVEVMYTRSTSSRMNTYTTIDRGKAKEMREDFEAQFEKELHMAVAGIDIHASACFAQAEQPQIRDIITFHTTII